MAYKKGIETKQLILETSRDLFYKYGYEKTTVSMIAVKAEINPGLIPYYFTHKKHMAGMVFMQISTDVNNAVKSLLKEEYDSKILWMMQIWGYCKIIFDNSNFKRFYYELMKTEDIVGDYYKPVMYDILAQHSVKANLNLPDNKLKIISSIVVGAQTKLIDDKILNSYELSYDDISCYIFHLIFDLFGYPESVEVQFSKTFESLKSKVNISMKDKFTINIETI